MTELSPAAQTVLTAFAKASDGEYVDGEWQQDDVGQLAAALRAATANQNKQIDVPFSKIDQWENIKGSTLSYWTAAQWGYKRL
jgi:hypothetical protein